MGISLYAGLGAAGLLVLLALLVLFWPKGKPTDPKSVIGQMIGIPADLGRVDEVEHARRKVQADEALAKEARAKVEAELMRRRAAADALQQARRDADLMAALASGLEGSPTVPPAPGPARPAP